MVNLYLLLLNSPLCLRAFLTSLGDDTARERRVIAEVRPYFLCFVSGGEGGGEAPLPPGDWTDRTGRTDGTNFINRGGLLTGARG